MATTSIDQVGVFITNGSVSGDTITTSGEEKVVRIVTTQKNPRVEYDYVNTNIISIDPVVTELGEESERKGKNLLGLKQTITIVGYLEEESGTSAISKRKDLHTIIASWNQVVTVVWGTDASGEQQKEEGHIIKAKVVEASGRVVNKAQIDDLIDRSFMVNIQILVEGDL